MLTFNHFYGRTFSHAVKTRHYKDGKTLHGFKIVVRRRRKKAKASNHAGVCNGVLHHCWCGKQSWLAVVETETFAVKAARTKLV